MFSAVHSDRSGRLVVAADYAAAVSDGVATRALSSAIPLPGGADVVALQDRVAIGIDRSGHPRSLGSGRWGVGAVLAPGHLRLALPAYLDDAKAAPLPARSYAPVGADTNGDLVVEATLLDPEAPGADGRSSADLASLVTAVLRDQPSSRLVRQLARCAREYRCRAAANAFLARHDCAVPVAAPTNERPLDVITLRDTADALPTEPAAFKPTAEEIAEAAVRHFEGGGTMIAFGRACEGEPLLVARLLEAAIVAIRERTPRGTVHLETNGSLPAALRRLCDAGLDSVAVRIVSARADTFEAVHRPEGFRLAEVRTSIAEVIGRKVAVAILVLALPGLTDRASELDALVALAGSLPEGSTLLLRDLAADPQRALRALGPADAPLGMDRALERLRTEAAHVRIATLARPLVRL